MRPAPPKHAPQRPIRILVVEDEQSIIDIVTTALRFHHHEVTQSMNGLRGLELARTGDFDLVILDVMLPGIDGLEVCRRLRHSGISCPVLFLTARDKPADRVEGFVTGADDYLTKPFSVDELVLRVEAIVRRTRPPDADDVLVVADLTLSPSSEQVWRAQTPIELTRTEFQLLRYLMLNRGVVVSKAQILINVWDDDFDGTDNIVELYIGYLRRKIGTDPPLIHTRRGSGYVLRSDDA